MWFSDESQHSSNHDVLKSIIIEQLQLEVRERERRIYGMTINKWAHKWQRRRRWFHAEGVKSFSSYDEQNFYLLLVYFSSARKDFFFVT